MCGTPLPQRPITAPGAASTWSFTRLPIESPRSTTVLPQAPQAPDQSSKPVNVPKGAPAAVRPIPVTAPQTFAPRPLSGGTVATPAPPKADPAKHDYFAEAERAPSLEQFVANFRYTPPAEEDEVTMSGEKPVAEQGSKYEPGRPVSLSDEPEPVTAESAAPVTPVASPVAEPEPAAPVAAKETTVEPLPAERARFLDISAPASAEPPRNDSARSGTSTIVGPSFLGLSDAPVFPAEPSVAAPEPRSHWRAWVALLVILVFGGLGFLEWRAEKNQDVPSPLEVMRMQIQRLKGKKGAIVSPETSSQPAATPAGTEPVQGGANAPDMQVVPPPQKPQNAPNTAPATNANPPQGTPSGENPGAASNATPSAIPEQTQAGQTASSGGGSESADVGARTPQPGSTVPNSPAPADAAKAAAPAPAGPAGNEPAHPKPPTAGAEELAKADNASDAAAASAWLWKAVAKGNPEAPVRLANMYIKGDGVTRSCEQAVVLLKSAAAKENAAARSKIGSLYATGTCVPRDRVRAYEYMSSALEANPNAVWARDFREQLWAQMTPQERTQAQRYR
jgi:hypothetical protein